MASDTTDFFQTVWLNLFNKAQDKFDQKEQRAFNKCEAKKEANFMRLRNDKLIPRANCNKRKIRRRRLRALRREAKKEEECPPPPDGDVKSSSVMFGAALSLSKQLRRSKKLTQRFLRSSRPVTSLNVTIQGKEQALAFAHDICNREGSRYDLVFWTDASGVVYSNPIYGCAVASKENGTWNLTTGVMPSPCTVTAEFHAILLALEMAVERIEDIAHPRPDISVRVFSDSMSSLQWIDRLGEKQKPNCNPEAITGMGHVGLIGQHIEQLGARLELHWVPRGQVEGNRVADSAARVARMKADVLSPRASDEENSEEVVDTEAIVAFGSSLCKLSTEALVVNRKTVSELSNQALCNQESKNLAKQNVETKQTHF